MESLQKELDETKEKLEETRKDLKACSETVNTLAAVCFLLWSTSLRAHSASTLGFKR